MADDIDGRPVEGEVVEAKPNTRVLANGAVYDMNEKRIVANPGGGTTAITQAQASAMAKTRWDHAAAATRSAIKDVSKQKTSILAWSKLISGLYTSAIDTDKPLRDRTIAAKFIGQAADLLPDAKGSQEAGTNNTQINVFSAEASSQLISLLSELRNST